jgi:hypothetical protein
MLSRLTRAIASIPRAYPPKQIGGISRYFVSISREQRECVIEHSNRTDLRFKKYQSNAVARNKSFELSFEQAKAMFTSPCHYCKKPAKLNEYNGLNGIDRVDNSRGYHLDNTVPCCKVCNYMKGVLDMDEFLVHCKRVADCFDDD